MKKLALLSFAALLMAGCSDDVTSNSSKPELSDDGVSRKFLSVSLVSPRSGSRADDGTYVDGEDYENKVNSVRFFFFYDNGQPTDVYKQRASGDYLSYIDWIPEDHEVGGGDPSEKVEKILTATLGLNLSEAENYPELVIAIVNPTPEVYALTGNPTLADLRGVVSDYYTGLHYNNFVITNSVYTDKNSTGENVMIDATPITEKNLADTEEDALNNKLIIYVERVLARLDFRLNLSDAADKNPSKVIGTGDNAYTIYQVSKKTIEGNDSAVYVRFFGWNLTATTDSSRLVKLVNPEWKIDIFNGEGEQTTQPWNIAGLHRSFWAINPDSTKTPFSYQYSDFGLDGNNKYTGYKMPANGGSDVVTAYMQENAAKYTSALGADGAVVPTKVFIAGQLVNEDGNPMQLAKWANRYYTQSGVLTAVTNSLNIWRKTVANGQTTYTKITPADLKIVSALELFGEDLDEDGEIRPYYSFIQLSDAGEKTTWYKSNDENAEQFADINTVNEEILNRLNYILAWNSGYTYYYIDIRHLGAEGCPGYYGVVRNHIYDTTVSKISGLGTPVWNPDEVIYPEVTVDDNKVIYAEVRILQWRVVSQSYEISW